MQLTTEANLVVLHKLRDCRHQALREAARNTDERAAHWRRAASGIGKAMRDFAFACWEEDIISSGVYDFWVEYSNKEYAEGA